MKVMKLLIVESPSKAKTIEKYLDNKYTVRASVGHIRDLLKSNKKAVDIENEFKPTYEISPLKKKVVDELKSIAKKANEVVLATDLDREGEAIAWHLQEALGLKNPKRIVFNEITETAIKEALKHPREVDMDLKNAQEARRVLDRLFGYDLSGLIWKKVRYGLSAGRVQSPALRIIMEREREIRAFIPEKFYILTALLKKGKDEMLFTCDKEIWDKKEAEDIFKKAQEGSWSVMNVKETEAARAPRAPFTTSTMQQVASTRLGFAPSRTMGVAQKLYEKGLITYMRTDSTNLSKDAQAAMLSYVKENLGVEYAQSNVYSKKSKNAQEAHEAIRPTNPSRPSLGTTEDEKKLYRLIWERAIASQMTPAKILRTKISANVGDDNSMPNFSINGSRILFPGWLAVDTRSRGEDVEVPKLGEKDALDLVKANMEEKETTPPGRYTEAGLIKELEKRDIGRPSTYASTIKTIVDRGYVIKEGRTLIPTDTGDVVSTFIETNFKEYISDDFTAEMEKELDEIALGKATYVKTLSDFYGPFTKALKAKEDIEKLTNLGDAPAEFPCPICGKSMVYKLSKNGKFMSCSDFPTCAGARTEEGKELEPPKEIGEMCPKCGDKHEGKLVQREGRFGLFISCSRYPKCKFIKESEEEVEKKKTGVKCTECKDGEMVERKGRFGIFFSCSNYPDCKHAIKTKPTGKLCKMCGKLMMEGTKTIPERCSDKKCPNHRPDKVAK
ncbi:MAG: type I DNA topoisomerase [Candidatus Paceibacterota bacterium]